MMSSVVNFLAELGSLEIALVALFGVQVAFCLFSVPYAIYVLCKIGKNNKQNASETSRNNATQVASDLVGEENNEVAEPVNENQDVDGEENTASVEEVQKVIDETVDENQEVGNGEETAEPVDEDNQNDEETIEVTEPVDETVDEENNAPTVEENEKEIVEENVAENEDNAVSDSEETNIEPNQDIVEAEDFPVEDERSVGAPQIPNEETLPIQEDEEVLEENIDEIQEETIETADENQENVDGEENTESVEEVQEETIETVDESQETDDGEENAELVEEDNQNDEETIEVAEPIDESVDEENNETVEEENNEPIVEDNEVANIEETPTENTESVDLSQYEPQVFDGFLFFNALKRSFLSKIIQANETTQNYYSQIKNKLLSYRKIHDRLSWGAESFRLGRALKAKMTVRGKTLCLFLALNPDEFNKNIYHQRNFGDRKKYAQVPLMVKVRSPLGLKRALNLIEIMLKEVAPNKKFESVVYSFPYETDDELIARDLIRRIRARRFFDVHEGESEEEAVVRIVTETQTNQLDEAEDNNEGIEFADVEDTEVELPELFDESEDEEEIEFVADESENENVIPELPENKQVEETPEFAVEDERNVGSPVIDNDEVAPVFIEEDRTSPDAIEKIQVEETPEFATDADIEDDAPTEFVSPIPETSDNIEETPKFAVEDERNVGSPVIDNDEVAPVFVEDEDTQSPELIEEVEIQDVPEFASVQDEVAEKVIPEKIKEEKKVEVIPDFAGLDEETTLAPDSFAENTEDIPSVIKEIPPRDNSSSIKTVRNAEETPTEEFLSPDELPENEESVVVPNLAESNVVKQPKNKEESVVAPEFVNPDEISSLPETLPEAEVSKQSRLVKAEEVKPEFVSDEENELPPEELSSLPQVEENVIKEENAPQSRNVPTKFEDRPSTLPQGLYDDVPEDKKPVKKVEKQEKKYVIPEGLTDEEKRLIEENQAMLNGLMEDDEDLSENTETHEIVGTCTDTSGFNNFEMKLYNSSNNIKYYYSEIKNTLLSYKGIKCKQSNAGDSFRQGNNLISRITLNGNKLRLHLALNPKDYSQNVYNHYSFAHLNAYKEVPFTLEVTKRSDLNTCVKLIQDAMASKYVIYLAKNREWVDYAAQYTKKED